MFHLLINLFIWYVGRLFMPGLLVMFCKAFPEILLSNNSNVT